jgi:GNAT superfamily N-acetyltransferase
MLSDATMAAIFRWVTAKFDLDADEVAEEIADELRWYFKVHGPTLADYHGVYVWRMEQITFISTPSDFSTPAIVTLIQAYNQPGGVIYALDLHDPFDAVGEPVFWRRALGERVERIIGPTYQGFVDVAAFRPAETQGARPLTASDLPALQRFIAACPPDDWQDSAIAPDHAPLIGLERAGELIALASAPLDGPAEQAMRSIGVVTLPAARGTGAGLAVVSALTERCLALGATLHYQTLRANLPSIAIAQRLGFGDLATSLAVRLG